MQAWRRVAIPFSGVGRATLLGLLNVTSLASSFFTGQVTAYRFLRRVVLFGLLVIVLTATGVWLVLPSSPKPTDPASLNSATRTVDEVESAKEGSGSGSASHLGPVSTPLGREAIYAQTLKSTVWVVCRPRNGTQVTGTGWVVDGERGYVMTNEHVVGQEREVAIYFPERDTNGEVVAQREDYFHGQTPTVGNVIRTDPRRDLALIQLNQASRTLHSLVLSPASPRPGQEVHTVGNPGFSGALWVYTFGTVRQVYHTRNQAQTGSRIDAMVVETQSPTNAGDSGGPVVNDRCELVAVVQSHCRDARLVTIAIDVSEVRSFLADAVP
jgi:S1-C subfamily serine protease